jgi:hypothetical protein
MNLRGDDEKLFQTSGLGYIQGQKRRVVVSFVVMKRAKMQEIKLNAPIESNCGWSEGGTADRIPLFGLSSRSNSKGANRLPH